MFFEANVDQNGKMYLPRSARKMVPDLKMVGQAENGVLLVYPMNIKDGVLEKTIEYLLKEKDLKSEMENAVNKASTTDKGGLTTKQG